MFKNQFKIYFIFLIVAAAFVFPNWADAGLSCSTPSASTVEITSSGCVVGSQFIYRNGSIIGSIGCNSTFYDDPPVGTHSYSANPYGSCSATTTVGGGGGAIAGGNDTGTIKVSSNILASWTINPGNITSSGNSATYSNKSAGQYTITWGSVSGYATPNSQTVNLTEGGEVSFSGNYMMREVIVSSNISTSWTLAGPQAKTGSGTFGHYIGMPAGTYSINWGDVSGYTTPVSQSLVLGNNNTQISFQALYVVLPGAITVSSNISTNWTITSNNNMLLWAANSNPSPGEDIAKSIAVDSTGVYIAGCDVAPGDTQWRVEKRSLTGDILLWAVNSNPSSSTDCASSIAVNSTGVYVAGYDYVPGNAQWRVEKRSLTTGALVASFGSGGVVNSNPSSGSTDSVNSIAIDSSGIYIAGYSSISPSSTQWRVEKRNLTNGALITSFGSGGAVISSQNNSVLVATSIAVDPTGVYIAGYDTINDALGGAKWRIEKRSLTNGALITSFGSGGVVRKDYSSGDDGANSIAVDSTGIYIAGSDGTYRWYIEKRSLTNGALITSFGSGGAIKGDLSSGGGSLVVDSAGIYIAGSDVAPGNAQWRIEKRNLTTGALIASFGGGGVARNNPSSGGDFAYSIAVNSTGVYVVGYDYAPGNAQWRVEKRVEDIKDGGIGKIYTPMTLAGYTINWGDVAGYLTPPSETKTLLSGSGIYFIGNYTSSSTLFIDLLASPDAGFTPLDSIITATISGTSPGTINYTFYCNRNDFSTEITAPYDAKFDGVTDITKTATCNYNSSGTFYPKVIVEKSTVAATDVKTVIVSAPPAPVNNNPQITATDITRNIPIGCGVSPSSLAALNPILRWTYSDADGDTQSSYRVIVKNGATTVKDSGTVSSSASFYDLSGLGYSKSYTWTIQVWDAKGGASGAVSGAGFTTIAHDLPNVLFGYFPTPVLVDTNTQFCSMKEGGCASLSFTPTTCSVACNGWQWTLPTGANFIAPSSSASKNPIVKLQRGNNQNISLRVSDSDNYYCEKTTSFNIGLPLPEIRERVIF